MGLNLDCYCNLLNKLLKNINEALLLALDSLSVHTKLDNRLQSKQTNIMDGSVEQRSTESIKITMLQHEQVFKQQVHELHRLYEVQKKLMAELRSRDMKVSSLLAKDKLQGSTSTSETSHSCHFSAGNQSNSAVKSGQNLLNRFSPATTVSNYFSESFFSEGEGRESCSEEDCNLDLTLSIGCNSDKKKRETWEKIANESSHLLEWSAGFDAESLKRPQWLFQALSLNRT